MSDCAIHGVTGIMCDPECVELTRALLRSHICDEHAIDYTDEPRPSGTVNVITKCGICRRKLSQGATRVLWAY